jgi:hypothetical protein
LKGSRHMRSGILELMNLYWATSSIITITILTIRGLVLQMDF